MPGRSGGRGRARPSDGSRRVAFLSDGCEGYRDLLHFTLGFSLLTLSVGLELCEGKRIQAHSDVINLP